VTLMDQWDECITEFYHNVHHQQTQTLSSFFLHVLCLRLGNKSVLEDELSAVDVLPLLEIQEVETLYQKYLGRKVRMDTGSFYTPNKVAAFMVKESFRTHFLHHVSKRALPYFPLENTRIQSAENSKASVPEDVHTELIDWFSSLHVLDLSCGSGVFLRHALVALVNTGIFIFNANGNHRNLKDLMKECVEDKLTGIEFQPDTQLLAEILLKLQIQEIGRDHFGSDYNEESMRLAGIQPDIRCENALWWNDQDKDAASVTKYTLILGNPPYIGEKGNTNLFNQAKDSMVGKKYYEKNMDFSYYFLHKGLNLLAMDGVLCYVTTSYFATADGAKILRKRLQEQVMFHWLVYPESVTLFPNAKGQHNLIYCLSCKKSQFMTTPVLLHQVEPMTRDKFIGSLSALQPSAGTDDLRVTIFDDSSQLFDQRGQLLIRSPGQVSHILEKICGLSMYQLQDVCTINQGVVSGADKMTKQHEKAVNFYEVGRGIFVLSEQEKEGLVEHEPALEKFLKPFYKNSQITPYFVAAHTNQWLLYLTDENMPSIDWSEPLSCHLMPFKAILSRRREVQHGVRKWHSLHWPRNAAIFEKEKMVAPQRSALNIFGYTAEPWYASADVYFIQRRDTCFYSIEYLLLWLNSALCYAWLSYYGKMKGKDLELYATPLKQIPIPAPPSDQAEKWMQIQHQKITKAQGNADVLLDLVREVDYEFFKWFDIDPRQCSELLTHIEGLRKKMINKKQ